MDKDVFTVALTLILCVAFLAVGILIGLEAGSDSIANEWCSSLGYASGYHSNMDASEKDTTHGQVVCRHAELVKVESLE